MNHFQKQVHHEAAALHSDTPVHPKYRPDIDGLRAVAVLCVVIFHAFPDALKGGFIGVDIFFVISGFLISTIIISNLERGSFSFADFYGRRVRRIFPVLLLVLAACFVAGWFVLLGAEYKQLGKHMAGGAGFVANYVLWDESGYFDNAAHTKPLLHLWSLGVEEQFYLVWPALLWFAARRGFNLLTTSIVLGLLSFGLNVAAVHGDAMRAFYSPQTRFWQMLTGSTLAALTLRGRTLLGRWQPALDGWLGKVIYAEPQPRDGAVWRDVQSLLGAGLILIGLLRITQERAFPGWWAVLPTLGAAMIIAAGSRAWFNRVVLGSRVLVWFGLISFPLYLWHWPLLVFARMVERSEPSAALGACAVAASVVLAWLSYHLLERPIRAGGRQRAKTVVLLVLMLAVGGVGYNTYERDGLGFRMKDRQAFGDYFENYPAEWRFFFRVGIPDKYHLECEFFDIAKYRAGRMDSIPRPSIDERCYKRDPSKPKAVLLWGDSHAEHLSFGIRNNLPADWQVLQVASSGCLPTLAATGPSDVDQCTQNSWFALKTIADTHPDVVVVAQSVGHTLEGMKRIAERLQAMGVPKVVFPGPDPHWTEYLPKLMMTKLWLTKPRRTFAGIDRELMASNAALQAGFPKSDRAVFVNLMDFFCNQDGCLTYLGDDPMTGITSYDYSHLMPQASDLLGKQLLAKVITGDIKP
ncbi:acyltransferase [Rugamonas sp. A1-17]|nr:acyltransferase [Rugamonas sp. A1-17]